MKRSCNVWAGHSSVTRHPCITNTLREPRTSLRHSNTSYSGIIPHQNYTQRYYLLDIFTSSIRDTTEGITKATATKQSINWERWCTLLTYTGIANKLLDGILQGEKTIMVSSFAASVQRNYFCATRKPKLLYRTVKAAVLDVSTSF